MRLTDESAIHQQSALFPRGATIAVRCINGSAFHSQDLVAKKVSKGKKATDEERFGNVTLRCMENDAWQPAPDKLPKCSGIWESRAGGFLQSRAESQPIAVWWLIYWVQHPGHYLSHLQTDQRSLKPCAALCSVLVSGRPGSGVAASAAAIWFCFLNNNKIFFILIVFAECKKTVRGKDYTGTSVNTSETGKPCLDWATQTLDPDPELKRDVHVSDAQAEHIFGMEEIRPSLVPYSLLYIPLNSPCNVFTGHCLQFAADGGRKNARNYCRNVLGLERPFCIVNDPKKPRQFCNVPDCEDLTREDEHAHLIKLWTNITRYTCKRHWSDSLVLFSVWMQVVKVKCWLHRILCVKDKIGHRLPKMGPRHTTQKEHEPYTNNTRRRHWP